MRQNAAAAEEQGVRSLEKTMTLPKWWNHGKNPSMDAANLIALTVVFTAAWLTADWMLLVVGTVMEALYLVWASRSARYHKRLTALEESHSGEYGLDRVLLVVTIAGFEVILFFGFGKHLLNHRWPNLSHAGGWEAGAIVWTLLFLVYYISKFQLTGSIAVDKIIVVMLCLLYGWLLFQALEALGKPHKHVLLVLCIGFGFTLIDFLNMKFHSSVRERQRSRESFFWADLPMVVAFFVLLLYLCAHRDTENPDVFVSGVISCQLLMSNAVFVVMEFGWLRPASPAGGAP